MLYVVALVVALIIIIPVAYAVLGGFRTNRQLIESPTSLPDPWVWSNYGDTLTNSKFWRELHKSRRQIGGRPVRRGSAVA